MSDALSDKNIASTGESEGIPLEEVVRNIEKEFEVPPGFLGDLFREPDDWSFVIKGHSLLDVSLAHLITKRLGCADLAATISRLGIGGKDGKVAFVESLNLLGKEEIEFIHAFTDLRNHLAHGLDRLSFKINDHFKDYPRKGKKIEFERVLYLYCDPHLESTTKEELELIKSNPRRVIFIGLMLVLIHVYSRKSMMEDNLLAEALKSSRR